MVVISGLSVENVGKLPLYAMRTITKGMHTYLLASLSKRSTENSQTGRKIFVVLCPHCGKDLNDIWLCHLAFLLKEQLYETVINMFVLKNNARRFPKSTYPKTRVILVER